MAHFPGEARRRGDTTEFLELEQEGFFAEKETSETVSTILCQFFPSSTELFATALGIVELSKQFSRK